MFVIENGFQKSILSGEQANVAVYADASYFLKYRNEYLAVSYANAYFSGGISVKKYMIEGQTMGQAKISNDPLPVYTHILYNTASGYGSFVMPGIILIIIQQTLLIGIGFNGWIVFRIKSKSISAFKRKIEIRRFYLI